MYASGVTAALKHLLRVRVSALDSARDVASVRCEVDASFRFVTIAPSAEVWPFATDDFERASVRIGDMGHTDPRSAKSVGRDADAPFAWTDSGRLFDWLGRHDGPVIVAQRERATRCAAETPSVRGMDGFKLLAVQGLAPLPRGSERA